MVYHVFVFKSIPVIVPFADNEQDSFSDDSADYDEEIVVTIVLLLQCSIQYRPVGWSGDGGVRETMRVELTSGGGAFPGVWGSAISSPIGVWGGVPAALQLLQC